VGSDIYTSEWLKDHKDDLQVVSTDSPLGSALLAGTVGQTITFDILGRPKSVAIKSLDQSWINKFISSD
jgi:transcription elongation GreA/GreB family factor